MKTRLFTFFVGLFALVIMSNNGLAQATAQISGTARDQSGAVLPGVEVTVTQTETGITRDTITNETGSYVLPNLPIGPYRLEASLPGFRTYAQTGIVLQVNSSPAINVFLEVGQVTETVEVRRTRRWWKRGIVGVGQVDGERAHSGTAAEWTGGDRADRACRSGDAGDRHWMHGRAGILYARGMFPSRAD